MEHYFTSVPNARSEEQEVLLDVLGEEIRCTTDRAVFSGRGLDEGTRILLETVEVPRGARILDLGAGWGAIAVTLGVYYGCEVVCVERNERAAALCARNLQQNRVEGTVLVGDGLDPVAGQQFDLVLLNPPIRAGKAVYYPWLAAARGHLLPNGALWVVVRTNQGAKSLRRELEAHYSDVREVAIERGYRVYCAR
ncbi:MAG: methyltransferase [Thermaerobacter sp.]|nr:methyltransferase [Thermaerobacter sp.]